MKFSFSLIKKIAPGSYSKKDFVEGFNLHAFETVDLGGDALEISVTPNRFSSAGSHIGIAREASAIFNVKFIDPVPGKIKPDFKDEGVFGVNIKDKDACPRYSATYVSEITVGPSPEWLKDALEVCGLRSINSVVDVMNYVMLETGQPLHAFDADKVTGGIIVRKAKAGEEIETIDNNKFKLSGNALVIADEDGPLAIAGIKGGKRSEVSLKTKRLIVESANFESSGIYKSSRALNLRTDASAVFSHNISPALAEAGMKRALQLLKEICGAKIHKTIDVFPGKEPNRTIKLDIARIERIIGVKIKKSDAEKILSQLGFRISKNLVYVPPVRNDVELIEDLAEEIARIQGLNNLPAVAPKVFLGAGGEDDNFVVKEKIRKYLVSAGYSEVYNYSFLSAGQISAAPAEIFGISEAPALRNPLSAEFAYLRDSLAPNLRKNLEDNARYFAESRIFEISKIFGYVSGSKNSMKISEKPVLGIAVRAKDAFLEIKGILDGLFADLGITDWFSPDLNLPGEMLERGGAVRIETGDHAILGYAGMVIGNSDMAVLELDLEKLVGEVVGEKEYEPLPKFPSIERDISILVPEDVRVGKILELIQASDLQHVSDVDMIDYYDDDKFNGRKSLSFRIVFQADNRTLTDEEVDREVEKIIKVLVEEVDAEIR